MPRRPIGAGAALPNARRPPRGATGWVEVVEMVGRRVGVRAADGREGILPTRHVEREFRAYLGCGDVANGFAWLECQDCNHHRLVLFSCKIRGFCPSCGADAVRLRPGVSSG